MASMAMGGILNGFLDNNAFQQPLRSLENKDIKENKEIKENHVISPKRDETITDIDKCESGNNMSDKNKV